MSLFVHIQLMEHTVFNGAVYFSICQNRNKQFCANCIFHLLHVDVCHQFVPQSTSVKKIRTWNFFYFRCKNIHTDWECKVAEEEITGRRN